jgi:hypothetical protein
VFVGSAELGGVRGDVAGVFGGFYSDSGYSLVGAPLPAGTYDLVVFAHNARTGTFSDRRVIRVSVK